MHLEFGLSSLSVCTVSITSHHELQDFQVPVPLCVLNRFVGCLCFCHKWMCVTVSAHLMVQDARSPVAFLCDYVYGLPNYLP